MDASTVHPTEEIKRLQRCINDLVSVLALPAMWTGGDPTQIARTLIDGLLEMLHLDVVYVWVKDPAGEPPLEMGGVARSGSLTARPQDIGEMLRRGLGTDPQRWPAVARNQIGDRDMALVSLGLGVHGDLGVLVAGSERADFPRQTERLLLGVAANQAAIGLRESWLLAEQKRVARELDQRVAQRARELATANEELSKEIAAKAAILDSALDCIVRIDHEGRITEFNPAAEWTFGYRRADVVGRELADVIIPPSLRDLHRRGFARYLATGEAHVLGRHVEMTAVRADGSEFPVEIAITRMPSDGPPSFTGWLRDITARKEGEEKLRRSEAFLAEAQRLSLTGSFSWRVATDEITWSDQVYRIFDLDRGDPVTLERILARVHPEDVTPLRDMVDRARRDASDFEYEHRLLMPDHSIKYLHLVGRAVPDQDKGLEYVGTVQDVTDRRLSEEALGKARSDLAYVARVTSLGVLTASIAHEVSQPLAGIITNAGTCLRMLAADPPNVDGARETVRRTIRDGNRASDVVKRLRTLFAKHPASTEAVDLNDATREVMALSQSELQRGRVIVRMELADDLPPVSGDRVQLQQVILNLLLNASDAMSGIGDRPRELVIRTQRDEEDRVRLSVQDAGVGLEPQGGDKLFEAFYTTKSGGMGIGLSVSRSIIESHQGRIWAEANEGPGATFAFSIPRAPAEVTVKQAGGAMPALAVTDAEHVMGTV